MAFIVAVKKKKHSLGGAGESGVFDEMEAALQSDARLPLPTKEDPAFVMEALLKKKIAGRTVKWKPVRVVLTKWILGLARIDQEASQEEDEVMWMSEYIPLHEIDAVRFATHNADRAAEEEAKKMEAELGMLDLISRVTHSQKAEQAKELIAPQKALNEEDLAIVISTVPEGVNGGRSYVLRAKSEEEQRKWHENVQDLAKMRKTQFEKHLTDKVLSTSILAKIQHKCDIVHRNAWFKMLTAGMVCASFAAEIWEAEYFNQEWEEEADKEFFLWMLWLADVLFAVYFVVEVAINFLAHIDLWRRWFTKLWNWIDLLISLMSVVTLVLDGSAAGLIRPMRVFRVVRLFHRFRALNRVVVALGKSILPVFNAMMLLIVTTAAFAVLATTLFRQDIPNHFRDFSHSMLTMFQVCSGDSWGSVIVRGIFDARDPSGEQKTIKSVATFFTIYVLISGVILINVVIAVLLDEFIECITEEKERLASQREAEKEKELAALRPHGYMDPILRNMSRFTTAEHFHEKVDTLFQRLDVDGDGMLEYNELSDGLKAMKFTPPVTLTAEEYEILRHKIDGQEVGSQNRTLCDVQGRFNCHQFFNMMQGEMKRFALRELSTVMNEGDKNISRLGAMLKMLAISIDQIEHKIVHDRENRTNLANAVDTRADDVDQLGGSSVKMEDLAEHLPRAITAAVLSSGERFRARMQAVIEDHGQTMRKLMIGDEEKGARSLSASTEASSSAITNLTSGHVGHQSSADPRLSRVERRHASKSKGRPKSARIPKPQCTGYESDELLAMFDSTVRLQAISHPGSNKLQFAHRSSQHVGNSLVLVRGGRDNRRHNFPGIGITHQMPDL